MSLDEPWRQNLVKRLIDRNKYDLEVFSGIFETNKRLQSENSRLLEQNQQLLKARDKLRYEKSSPSAEIQVLEKKILVLQEELIDLHRKKDNKGDLIPELNSKLTNLTSQLLKKEEENGRITSMNNSLKIELKRLISIEKNLSNVNNTLRDEYDALKVAYHCLESRSRIHQEENLKKIRDQISEINELKEKISILEPNKPPPLRNQFIALDTTENRKQSIINNKFVKSQSEEPEQKKPILNKSNPKTRSKSLNEDNRTSVDGFQLLNIPMVYCNVSEKVDIRFDAHEGEVNAVQWVPISQWIATGGSDCDVKIWAVGQGVLEAKAVLKGSNMSINSIDFDCRGNLVLATSNDSASRVWTMSDQRLRHSLTGHKSKVMAGKFVDDANKVVTGSYDGTLKIWDLRTKACIQTNTVKSGCSDLVTSGASGTTIISGHLDSKIRFWDTRTNSTSDEIKFKSKITSLDQSKDSQYLLCCIRDDTLKMLDLRTNKVIKTFREDNFKVCNDWTRAAFNTDASAVAAGSMDGSVYIWKSNGDLQSVLKDNGSPVIAVQWHPFNSTLASVNRSKTCTIWSES